MTFTDPFTDVSSIPVLQAQTAVWIDMSDSDGHPEQRSLKQSEDIYSCIFSLPLPDIKVINIL
jgi:hypothetical protein